MSVSLSIVLLAKDHLRERMRARERVRKRIVSETVHIC